MQVVRQGSIVPLLLPLLIDQQRECAQDTCPVDWCHCCHFQPAQQGFSFASAVFDMILLLPLLLTGLCCCWVHIQG